MATNHVISQRNNVWLTNHIDKDGDLDCNYAMLRNTALTGKFVNGKFISNNQQRFDWLIGCAKNGCPICSGIFKDVKKGDYTIKPFYLKRVVIVDEAGKVEEEIVLTKWEKLGNKKKKKDPNQHPLYDLIIEKFCK